MIYESRACWNARSTVVFLAVACLSTAVRGDASKQARKEIISAYARQSSAFAKGDFEKFAASHTPDFFEQNRSGKKQSLEMLRQVLPVVVKMMSDPRRKVIVQSVKVKGSKAEVAGVEVIDGKVSDPNTGKKVVINGERTMTDTWIKKNAYWLRKVSRTISEKQTMDGKPFGSGR
jgi:hypothetical protein